MLTGPVGSDGDHDLREVNADRRDLDVVPSIKVGYCTVTQYQFR